MKAAILSSMILLSGCGALPTAPSNTAAPDNQVAANSPTPPQFTVSVGSGCVAAEALWPLVDIEVEVTDGGSTGIDGFAAYAHHSPVAGCQETRENPVGLSLSGAALYVPGPTSGHVTHFYWRPGVYSCGRAFVAVTMAVAGKPLGVTFLRVNYGRDC